MNFFHEYMKITENDDGQMFVLTALKQALQIAKQNRQERIFIFTDIENQNYIENEIRKSGIMDDCLPANNGKNPINILDIKMFLDDVKLLHLLANSIIVFFDEPTFQMKEQCLELSKNFNNYTIVCNFEKYVKTLDLL